MATKNIHMNKDIMNRVDDYINNQIIPTFASRKQFIELATIEKLDSLEMLDHLKEIKLKGSKS